MTVSNEEAWGDKVVQSITGRGGELIRQVTGIRPAAEPSDPQEIARSLCVSEHWDDADFEMYKAELGDRTALVIYSAMFFEPLAGTEAEVATHFGDTPQRLRGMRLFVAMKDNLVVPTSEEAPAPAGKAPMVLADKAVVAGSNVADPVGSVMRALGMPGIADRKKVAALLLTHYLPNTAVGVRTYLESRLHLRAFHTPLLEGWVASHPTLSAKAWKALSADAGGMDGLPSNLHVWFPLEAPFRQQLALAMTQDNDAELVSHYLPAMGTLMARRLHTARAEIRADFPDLGEWLANVACQ